MPATRCTQHVLKPLVAAALLLTAYQVPAYPLSDDGSATLDAKSSAELEAGRRDRDIAAALDTIRAADVEPILARLVAFGTRNTLSSAAPGIPPGQGVTAAAAWIEDQFRAISAGCGGCLEVHRDSFVEQPPALVTKSTRIPFATPLTNVYAVLRGSDPAQRGRMVLVTGHYDSRATDVLDTHTPAPGANDDASGVAVSLLAARALSHLHLPATVVFVAVAGEEQGLNGSHHLAAVAESEGWDLEAVLNNDIVGGDTTPGSSGPTPDQSKSTVRVFSEGIPATATPEELRRIEQLGYESDSPSRELARTVSEVSATYFPAAQFHPTLIFRTDRFLRGGDHTSFNKSGFAAVRFTEWRENFNHQHQNPRTENGVEYGDLLKFVDTAYVARVAQLNAATLATLASAPPPPREVQVVTKDLDNNTTLTWQPGPGSPAGTQFRVVWRATDAPLWQHSQIVSATTATLPVSKDNVIFAVEAVDYAGHQSTAVPPLPAR
jgi:hypothetical protein